MAAAGPTELGVARRPVPPAQRDAAAPNDVEPNPAEPGPRTSKVSSATSRVVPLLVPVVMPVVATVAPNSVASGSDSLGHGRCPGQLRSGTADVVSRRRPNLDRIGPTESSNCWANSTKYRPSRRRPHASAHAMCACAMRAFLPAPCAGLRTLRRWRRPRRPGRSPQRAPTVRLRSARVASGGLQESGVALFGRVASARIIYWLHAGG